MTMLRHPRRRFGFGRLAATVLLTGLLLGTSAPASSAAEITHLAIWKASGQPQHLALDIAKSMIVDLPVDAHEVIVSQPAIASGVMRSKRRAILQGVGPGNTNILFLDATGRTIAVLDLQVQQQSSPVAGQLQATLARVLPGSNIKVETLSDQATNGKTHFLLTGTTQSAEDKTTAESMAASLSDDGKQVGSLIQVIGAQQVALKVTIAEVSRSAVKQLGINLSGSLTVGAVKSTFASPSVLGGASGVVTGNAIGSSIATPNFSIDATISALEQRGLLRKLDEPTLTAMSGQAATFAVGGQIPVINPPDDAGRVSYSYKQLGANLAFTPVVKSNGNINITIDASVSDIDNTYAVTVGNASIPGISNREAKTVVEVPAGATLSIGGMFQDRVREQISRLPGLGQVPILGALFRSRDFIHEQTELVILVTPYLTNPGAPPTLPTDGVVPAGDAEAVFLGHMQKLYGVSDPSGNAGQYRGSIGFALD